MEEIKLKQFKNRKEKEEDQHKYKTQRTEFNRSNFGNKTRKE